MDRAISPPAERDFEPPFHCWESGGFVFFGIKVQPGAKREKFLGLWDRKLRLSVRAPAEKGRANEAAIDFLAESLGIKPAKFAIVAGESSREKTIRVAGLSAKELSARIVSLT